MPATPVTRRGDLWLLGEHRLLCGDSTDDADVTRLMAGERAALFATDPPYLVDYDGTNHPTKKSASTRAKKIANKDWSEDYVEQKHWDDSSQGPQFYEAFCRTAIEHAIAEDVAWYCWHASRRQRMLENVWDQFDVLRHYCAHKSILPIRLRPDFSIVFGDYAGGAEHWPRRQKGRKRSLQSRYSLDLLTAAIWCSGF